jgi:hypothetical protein
VTLKPFNNWRKVIEVAVGEMSRQRPHGSQGES